MQLNRFMWEDVEKGVFRKNKRIRTVLKFDNVIKVLSKNINQSKKDKFLDFLTIETIQMPDNNYEMKIVFAGDAIIRVISEVIEVTLLIYFERPSIIWFIFCTAFIIFCNGIGKSLIESVPTRLTTPCRHSATPFHVFLGGSVG